MSGSMWPQDLSNVTIVPPVALLREQANFLGAATQNIVGGIVRSGESDGRIVHHLILVTPGLGNFTYRLLTLTHDIKLYPVSIDAPQGQMTANDEGQLRIALRAAFNHEETKKILRSLIAQVQLKESEKRP